MMILMLGLLGQAVDLVGAGALGAEVDMGATVAIGGLLLFGAALYVLVEVIKRLLPERVTCAPWWTRALPLLAPLLGALLAPIIAHGWRVEGVPLGLLANTLAGLVAGWMSGGLYSTLAQTLMGQDRRLAAAGGGPDGDHDGERP